tara:strand:+ start:5718 stop:6896 length:1179 start_codon:yes stop_codon:yes gene_type:complete
MTILPKKLMLLGSGELGKEVAIAAKRIGCHVIACDRYKDAPAMQIADIAEVFNMNNAMELGNIINREKPDIIIPEIEAIEVNTLIEMEKKGITVIPNAKATAITMNREKIRDLASKKLGLKTAEYAYASNKKELMNATKNFKYPLMIKPMMSSSGKGQSLIKTKEELLQGWEIALKNARGNSSKIIIEEYITFDLEITLLTIRQRHHPTIFCDPIGHEQVNGDYQCSWQPAEVNKQKLEEAQLMAKKITDELGGYGLFGVEFFIRGNEVIFSELSPRPHDTGLVTLISQNINEFELHIRAILGLPIPKIIRYEPSASRVILAKSLVSKPSYVGIEKALAKENTAVFIFGKPNGKIGRRMGVALARGENISDARNKADASAKSISVCDQTSEV